MSAQRVPLGVLDLVPISSGAGPGEAIRNSIDLVRRAEDLGYGRYWFAEHHLNPGVAGTSPPVMVALAASATDHIRLGSGGVQSGHRTALSMVEEFGLIDAFCPGRLDLGVGRSGGRNSLRNRLSGGGGVSATGGDGGRPPAPERHVTEEGLLIPERPSLAHLIGSPRLTLTAELLQQQGAETAGYSDLLDDIVGLLRGTYRSPDGIDPRPVPGQGAGVQVWVLGSSAGESASAAGRLGLRFAANYHVSPATVLEAADGYRSAFVPSAELDRPYVAVSADVVVGPDDDAAEELAAGFGLWVRSIRCGEGAIEFPTANEAARYRWSDGERALVADRVDTQFVGGPEKVVAGLERLVEATGADELVVTTITHDHADRVRSYELLAKEWGAQAASEAQVGPMETTGSRVTTTPRTPSASGSGRPAGSSL
jgi:alkanesulfonate monooxygenase SsuD/methylene tetrahydromethanopterin reductase-like flavin-dependent oxidoreductase (luciferase family)